uniref:Uncharacterized protein n=1 Tax=Cacopsylla melanoneura TaxID=428564 RepID=A0A8D8LP65_9HEMI
MGWPATRTKNQAETLVPLVTHLDPGYTNKNWKFWSRLIHLTNKLPNASILKVSRKQNPFRQTREIREITYHGFDMNRIQQTIDHTLDLTTKVRETIFWELKPSF